MVKQMRKRAQRKSKPEIRKPKHIYVKQIQPEIQEKKPKLTKKGWIALSLIGIFFIVLFYNSFFNIASDITVNPDGTGLNKYYLSGPDPYYNMRLVEVTYETGEYPFYDYNDPLLNYPLTRSGGRAPLFNMMALGFSRLLTPFMDEVDAIGRSMQFVPALFGALLIFPVYFIGKTLFNKKAGLIAAFFVAIIPIHIGSGHGSAYSLFDHDSFNLLLFFITFMFLIFSIKEKNTKKSILYALLGGVPLAGLSMTWVEAEFLYVVIAVYTIVQMLFDIFLSKIDIRVFRSASIILLTGFFVSLPVIIAKTAEFPFKTPFIFTMAVVVFGLISYIFKSKRIPWTLSLPGLFVVAAALLGVLYGVYTGAIKNNILASLSQIANIIFGTGIYGKKVSMTIAEANTYQMSHTVMSFGPALYWVGWAGLLLLLYFYYKDKMRRDYLFMIMLFIINLWLTSTAGRFINDLVPVIALLAGGAIWFTIKKIDYSQMIRNIKSAGGGLRGIRKGMKLLHVFGILFIAIVVIAPNVFLTLDAAVPSKPYQKEDDSWTNLKWEIFGENHVSAFGLGVGKEVYWLDAFEWLSEQDTEIPESVDRPAFISWWDYGFYEVATGKHPTVADNFQDGIPPAGNFHTSTSEEEAVTVWIVRLLEGILKDNNYTIPDSTKDVFRKYLDENTTENITSWIENPENSPSYREPIYEEYHKYFKEGIDTNNLFVGAQWSVNAVYHDMVDLLVKNNETSLTDEKITQLYHDIQEESGYSIRYYGVEGYDKDIFNIFAFLSDKSLVMLQAPEDQFVIVTFDGQKYRADGEVEKTYTDEPLETYLEMTDEEKGYTQITKTYQVYKEDYFDSMFYKAYIGPYDVDQNTGEKKVWQNRYIPCINMRHFYAEYISDVTNPSLQYRYNGHAAVVISKYYEGAVINGSVSFNNESKEDLSVAVIKDLNYYEDLTIPIGHDEDTTDSDGNFSVIAGAGSYIQIRKNLGQTGFVVKNITFDGLSDSEYEPISDDDAMRRTNSNYERILDITIDPAIIEGNVFDDINNDEVFNKSVDTPLSDITVSLLEITNINEDNSFDVGDSYQLTTDENGYYNKTDLYPGMYRIIFYDDEGYIVDVVDKSLYEGNNTHNAIKRKPGDIEGIVYYDENLNEEYDSGEELEQATVTLTYNDKEIRNITVDADGSYKFEDLTSGWESGGSNINEYTIKAFKSPDYKFEGKVFAEENTTKQFNISIGLVPVTVTGRTLYSGEGIEEVLIEFEKDESIDLNTAESDSITTDSDGSYTIDLQPGSYNVTLTKSLMQETEETLVYDANYTLTLAKGQGTESKDFILEKRSVTISGKVTYDGNNVENATISFVPTNFTLDLKSARVLSDKDGTYSVELDPGTGAQVEYNISASTSNITGNDYEYYWTELISISENDIQAGVTKNILLERKED